MKLSFNIGQLNRAIEPMQPSQEGDFKLEFSLAGRDAIDIELEQGSVEVDIKDVDFDFGLVSYKGRNVLLYIKDHGTNVESVINGQAGGNKYHISDCSTLQSMREMGRYERYVVTKDTSGSFEVSGSSYYTGREIEGRAQLSVCKNCLRKLNYQGYMTGGDKVSIFNRFEMARFFSTYSSFFPVTPSREAQDATTGYTDDWPKVSAHYKVSQGFCCEQCKVDLSAHRHMLHTHHKNGVKSDNRVSNLKALCVDCHSKQPKHAHMLLTIQQRQLIGHLRREQSLIRPNANWQEVFELVDPGVHGVLHACKSFGTKVPNPGYEIQNGKKEVVAMLELAWPDRKLGIAIDEQDRDQAEANGWDVISVEYFVEHAREQCRFLM